MSTKVYDVIFKNICEQLDKGSVPWQCPWNRAAPKIAINAVTNKAYNGSNQMLLWLDQITKGYGSNKFATYKQWADLDRQVAKGERATNIVFWSKKEDEDTGKDYMFIRFYSVFNESQLADWVAPDLKEIDFKPIDKCVEIINASPMSKMRIVHDKQRACYSPTLDYINMPKPETFKSADKYYSTLFHEMGHATGHESRLNRDLSGIFGNHSYSREELIAELTSAFLGAQAGIQLDIADHASYCKSWLKKFKEEPKEMIAAFTRASKAVNYILNVKEETKTESTKEKEENEVLV